MTIFKENTLTEILLETVLVFIETCFCLTKNGSIYLSSYKNTVWFSLWYVIRFFTSLKQK